MSGTSDVVIAGGVQNMNQIPISAAMLAVSWRNEQSCNARASEDMPAKMPSIVSPSTTATQ